MSDLIHPGSTQKLRVRGCELITLRQHCDQRGPLAILGQGDAGLPFVPVRFFLTYGVTGDVRGEHAHRECGQLLLCAHGSVLVTVEDGERSESIVLDHPTRALYVAPMVWAEQSQHSRDSVLLVAASHPYDAADYLRTKDSWRRAVLEAREGRG